VMASLLRCNPEEWALIKLVLVPSPQRISSTTTPQFE
jgi:hypothetical protein